jgi:curved DNA-binding protein CbpA
MVEINEAKDVLLDAVRRREYDKKYDEQKVDKQQYGSEFKESEQYDTVSPTEENWIVAVGYYPDLKKIVKELSLISSNLANLYKNYMIESRRYDDRHKIKEERERDYLIRYYGDDTRIREYVRALLLKNFKRAAIAINKDIIVMGNSIDYQKIYLKIERKFPETKVCRLKPVAIKLKKVKNVNSNNLISKLENNTIWHVDTCTLFEDIFNTHTEQVGAADNRSYTFVIDGVRYNENIDYLKQKLIDYLRY